MSNIDNYEQPLLRLRELLPRLVDLTRTADQDSSEPWGNLDARLLPLIDKRLPLMVAVCGGANSGKSTLFNSILKLNLSAVRGDAGSTRRVLAAIHPDVLRQKNFMENLFEPFGLIPRPLEDSTALLEPGSPLFVSHPEVPRDQIWMDTPDFDTGSDDRYLNRHIAREVLEACNVLIYIVTNTTYNNLENTRFMRQILTETGMRRLILVYSCSRTIEDHRAKEHLDTTASNLYGAAEKDYLIGTYRTDTSDEVAAGQAFMDLRPIRSGEPDLMDLLRRLDPRAIRERQILSTLEAFVGYVRRLMKTSKVARGEIDLYVGTVQLALGRAVQQSLVSIPVRKILQSMNDLWLQTSPPHLKFFRGVGSVIGKPARMLLSLLNLAPGDETPKKGSFAKPIDPLEEIKSNLLGAASELRDHLLAEELMAEIVAKEPEGSRLTALVDHIRQHRGAGEKLLPFYQSAPSTGTVTLHVAAPDGTAAVRKALEDRPWSATAGRIVSTARDLLDIAEDAVLTAALTGLINEFRLQMNFLQRTRESFFASLNVLPATLGIAYILTTGDPVGGSGLYAKLHGIFGMHDLWVLVSIPASAGLDETGRKQLSDMLEPVVRRWLENRAIIVREVFEETIAGGVIEELIKIRGVFDQLIEETERELDFLRGYL
jgi:50S ribosome-binding GTPase